VVAEEASEKSLNGCNSTYVDSAVDEKKGKGISGETTSAREGYAGLQRINADSTSELLIRDVILDCKALHLSEPEA
jgi:hypothetical protein